MSARIRNRHRARAGETIEQPAGVYHQQERDSGKNMQPFVMHSVSLMKVGDKYIAPAGDTGLIEHFSQTQDLGQMVHGSLLEKIPAGSLVIDCGAFIGDTAIDFQKFGWKVIAFEPYLDNYLCLAFNSPKSLNIMAPVGNGSKVRLDYICPGENRGMRQVFQDSGGIDSFRLDDLPLLEKVAFIKIDVEGCELFVIQGAVELIKRDSPVLHVEVFPEKLHNHGISTSDLEKALRDLGYGFQIWGDGPKWDVYCSKDLPQSTRFSP